MTDNDNNGTENAGRDGGADDAVGAPDAVSLETVAEAAKAFADQEARQSGADENTDSGEPNAAGKDGKPDDQADRTGDGPEKSAEAEFTPNEKQVRMAKQLGVPQAEIDRMTPEQAKAFEYAARLDSKRQGRKGRQADKAAQGDNTAPAADENADGAESSAEGEPFSEDDWDDAAQPLNEMHRRMIQLEQRLAQYEAGETNQTQDAAEAAIEGFFSGLDGEIFADYMGDDEGGEIAPDSVADLKRTEVVELAVTLREKTGGTLEQSLEDALSIVDRDAAKAAAQKAAAKRSGQRNRKRMARPSATPTGGRHYASDEERAAASAAAELYGQ